MTRTKAETTAAVNKMLLITALKADRICERSVEQKFMRIEKMRAELAELGCSVVTTEWLNAVMAELPKAATEKART